MSLDAVSSSIRNSGSLRRSFRAIHHKAASNQHFQFPCAMQCHAMPRYAMLCHAMPCNAMLCHAMPCNAMLCHAMPCNAMQCHAMPCNAMLCHAMPLNAMQCHAMPCYAMQCHAMPCYAMLCMPSVVLKRCQVNREQKLGARVVPSKVWNPGLRYAEICTDIRLEAEKFGAVVSIEAQHWANLAQLRFPAGVVLVAAAVAVALCKTRFLHLQAKGQDMTRRAVVASERLPGPLALTNTAAEEPKVREIAGTS
eukprot:Skav221791  [mRNA]  locus=scaffold4067:115896:117948:- [translate_table: standard]